MNKRENYSGLKELFGYPFCGMKSVVVSDRKKSLSRDVRNMKSICSSSSYIEENRKTEFHRYSCYYKICKYAKFSHDIKDISIGKEFCISLGSNKSVGYCSSADKDKSIKNVRFEEIQFQYMSYVNQNIVTKIFLHMTMEVEGNP